jgi:endonuclease/exonuclease/phosphatase (EEP) superfamily protein YafD
MIRALNHKNLYRIVPEDDSVRVLGQATRKSLGHHFTMICWNMYKASRRGWLDDLTMMVTDADFVLLQEAMLHGDKAHPFHVASGFEWVMAQNFAYHSTAATSGVKTGSRIAAIKRTVLRSLDREPIIDLPKTMLATEYDILNTTGNLLVLNIHAINITSSRKFARQVAQLDSALSAHKGPVILAGDFNTWNPKRRRILFNAVEKHQLHRVPVGAPQWRHLNQVLDHVFYRGMTLKSATCMRHIRSSDHIPLRVEFEQLARV